MPKTAQESKALNTSEVIPGLGYSRLPASKQTNFIPFQIFYFLFIFSFLFAFARIICVWRGANLPLVCRSCSYRLTRCAYSEVCHESPNELRHPWTPVRARQP